MALLAGIGTVVGALLAYLLWVAWYHANPPVSSGLVSFQVLDAGRVEVTFEVAMDPAASAVCDVRAQNFYHEVAGAAEVRVGPSPQPRRLVTALVPTRELAVAGGVTGCRVLPR